MDAEHLSRQIIEYWNAFENIPLAEMGDEDRRQRIEGLITPASNDLRACRSSYRDGNYSPAVYSLQQATEKMSKAFLLRTGLMSARDTIRIGHDTLKGWIKLLEKMTDIVAVFAKNNPKVNTDLRDIKDLDRNKVKIAKMSYLDIINLLTIYDNFNRQYMKRLKKELPGLLKSPELPGAVLNAVNGICPSEGCNEADVLAKIENYQKNPEKLLNENRIKLDIGQLYIVSSLLYPHESFARYSHSEKGELDLKPMDYTKDLGIVRAIPNLRTRVESIYQTIKPLLE